MPNRRSAVVLGVPGVLIALAGAASAAPPLPFPPVIELGLVDGDTGFVMHGLAASDFSGRPLSPAGDINGDGFPDMVIGAPAADPGGLSGAGVAYVVFGGASVGSAGSIDLAGLTGADGFVIPGVSTFGDTGRSVSAAGDINGDGHDDLLVGASNSSLGGVLAAGRTYVVFGGPGVGASGEFDLSSIDGTNGFAIDGIDSFDNSAFACAGVGDFNGDGWDDLVIGAPLAEVGVYSQAGESYIVFGGPGVGASGDIDLADLDGSNGFRLDGEISSDRSGLAVARAGDVNDDGLADVLIAARNATANGSFVAGNTYVVFGSPTTGSSGSVALGSLDGTTGFVCNGIDTSDLSGYSIAPAGDINGDGVDDIVIGAIGGDSNGNLYSGEAYVVFGDAGIGAGGAFDLADLDGTNGFLVSGVGVLDYAGTSVWGAGDVNGDGHDDFVVGALFVDVPGKTDAGAAYVVFGGPGVGDSGVIELSSLTGTNGFVCHGAAASDFAGYSVAGVGDINGDGADDIMIGASRADPGGVIDAGSTYVLFGRVPEPCIGDLNGDGDTNAADFTILAGNFGMAVPPGTGGDLNGDGIVNAADFTILAGDLGCG
jgi:hypothetical protein